MSKTVSSSPVKQRIQLSFWELFKKTLVSSFSDLHYYASVLNLSVKTTLKLILCFYFLIALFQIGMLWIVDIPEFQKNVQDISSSVIEEFPNEAVVNWDGQILTTSPEEIISVPYTSQTNIDVPENWATLDTSRSEAPVEKDSLFFVSNQNLHVLNFQTEYQSLPLIDLLGAEPQQFTKDEIVNEVNTSQAGFSEIKNLLPFIAFPFFWFGTFLIRTMMIGIDSIIIYFIFTLLNRPLPYKKVLQLSWHVLIPVEVVHQLTKLLYPQSTVPMLSITYWVIMSLIIWNFRNLRMIKIEPEAKK